jgi:hypothetical protein
MKFSFKCILLFSICFYQNGIAQEISETPAKKDTAYLIKTPIVIRNAVLFSAKSYGGQLSIGNCVIQKHTYKSKKSGRTKLIKRDRSLFFDLGYYYQSGLHHNWFNIASYSMRRINKKGYYTELAPMLGISRTFLTDETYSVDEDGAVALKKAAGSWYIASGLSYGIGKSFSGAKDYFLKDIYLKLVVQMFYPNNQFIAIKPTFQVGTSFTCCKDKGQTKKISKYKSK